MKYDIDHRHLTLVLIILSVISCRQNPVVPESKYPLITSSQYANLAYTVIDYNVVHITHQSGIDLQIPGISRIGVGTKDSTGYKESLSALRLWDTNLQTFITHFDFVLNLDPSKILAPLTIRYYATESAYTDIDTSVDLSEFPYQSTRVFVTSPILLWSGGFLPFLDIAQINGCLYFRPGSPEGLYEYNLNNHQTKQLYQYSHGTHIAADSVFVYCDVNHNTIVRYQISTGTVDKQPFLSFFPFVICGMALYQQYLFVLVDNPRPQRTLLKFALDGAPLDSLSYPKATDFMTISDSVIYSVDYAMGQITRFDLRTKTFLPNVLSPAKVCNGIQVFGDQLYFCDADKNYVGSIPISQLLPVGVGTTTMGNRNQ